MSGNESLEPKNENRGAWKRTFSVLAWIVILSVVGLVVYWAIWADSSPEWTGFGAYDEEVDGPRAKTLWDWMSLLIVPVVLALGALWFNASQKKTEIAIANNRQKQATLEAYYDQMTSLLLNHQLKSSGQGDEKRSIARARTLAVLRSLDSERKGQVVKFLYESGLIGEKRVTVVSLSGADLSGADLRQAYLSEANLSEADLSEANLSRAHLGGADLREANLREANLSRAHLSGADLREASLREANLREANLGGVALGEANLSRADLSQADLGQANLIGARIDQETRIDSKWRLVWEIMNEGAANRDLSGVDLSGADLSGADLSGADLSGVDLRLADLREANLREANLRRVLGKAYLGGANLSGANLEEANLSGAYLGEANLSEANLSGTSLTEADLSGADLRDLRGWTSEQLQQIKSLENAIMPDGTKYEEWIERQKNQQAQAETESQDVEGEEERK